MNRDNQVHEPLCKKFSKSKSFIESVPTAYLYKLAKWGLFIQIQAIPNYLCVTIKMWPTHTGNFIHLNKQRGAYSLKIHVRTIDRLKNESGFKSLFCKGVHSYFTHKSGSYSQKKEWGLLCTHK